MTTDDKPATTDKARKPRPVTPELRARVKALHAEGLGRNAIAKELQIAGGTVTKIAQQHKPPLEFNRESTALAVMARQLDLADIRQQLARRYYLIAVDSLDRVFEPVKLGAFGGRDNIWNETLLDEPTYDARKVLVSTAQAAHRSALELLQADTLAGSVVGRSMVGDLIQVLKLVAETPDLAGVDPTVTPEQPAGT